MQTSEMMRDRWLPGAAAGESTRRLVLPTAVGALVALVSFVLPWFTLGDTTFNGLRFAESPAASPQRGAYMLALAALVALYGCFSWRRSGASRRTAMVVLAGGIVGLLVSLMYLLTALFQPPLATWVAGLSGRPNPNAAVLFGLGELRGLNVGLPGMLLGFLPITWAGWTAARASGSLEAPVAVQDQAASGTPVVRQVVLSGLLGAIAAFLGLTQLGFIPFPTGVRATIMHIAPIVGGIAGGWPVGLAVGAIFGVSSWLTTVTPWLKDPIVTIGARLFIGPVAYLVWRALRRGNPTVALVGAAIAGTLTNTLLVLGSGTLLHPDQLAPALALTVALTNAPAEVIIASILIVPIMNAVSGQGRPRRSSL